MAYSDPHDPRLLAARRRHYHANKEQYKARNRAKKKAIREYIQEVKGAPCVDCDRVYHYCVMDFDHLMDKAINVSQMVDCGSLDKVKKEIAKCELVCANCHRMRTHLRSVA